MMTNKSTNLSYPSYCYLAKTGKLGKIKKELFEMLKSCTLCPRKCGVNRLANEKGVCQVGKLPMVSSHGPHFGEEKPLVGSNGSGTIFMTHCNLRCIFCQNFDISQLGHGKEIETEELAEYMIQLQEMGCHNINFVTPTHVVPQITAALEIAVDRGLSIPLVYNCGGYESAGTLKLIEGVFDIYMPDFKYGDSQIAEELSKAPDYPSIAKKAIKEMHRQVGDLVISPRGVATQGLLVRHLVLPDNLAGTYEVLRFLSEEVSKNTYINIMDQYRPHYKAFQYPPLNRPIRYSEFKEAVDFARKFGLERTYSKQTHLVDRDSLC